MNPSLKKFYVYLDRIKTKCLIQDAEYWDLAFMDGETPIIAECNDTILSIRKDGYKIRMELGENFYVTVMPPSSFPDTLTLTAGTVIRPSGNYQWNHKDANLFRPIVSQPGLGVYGPVQIMDCCRSFILDMKTEEKQYINKTYQKNLFSMWERCRIRNTQYWDMTLQEGEEIISPPWEHECLNLYKDGFIIRIDMHHGWSPYHFKGSIQVSKHGHLDFFFGKNSSINIPKQLPHVYSDIHCVKKTKYHLYHWSHGNIEVDADMSVSNVSQCMSGSDGIIKRISGPAQILEEARYIIQYLKCNMKNNWVNRVREELMMKVCHPKRITKWIEQGFDSFQ